MEEYWVSVDGVMSIESVNASGALPIVNPGVCRSTELTAGDLIRA